MVERNAGGIARQLAGAVDLQDLLDAGYVKLVEKAQHFDSTRGVRLEAYARKAVRGAMYELARRREWKERSHSQLPAEGGFTTIGGRVLEGDGETRRPNTERFLSRDDQNPETLLEEKRRRATAVDAMQCLSDRERYVVSRYYDGWNLTEIGAQIGLPRKDSVCRIHTRALGKMRAYFAMRGIKAA